MTAVAADAQSAFCVADPEASAALKVLAAGKKLRAREAWIVFRVSLLIKVFSKVIRIGGIHE